MKHASSNLERASRRRLLGSMVTAALAVAAILVSAGPAAAAGSGTGTFTGDEHAPDSVFTSPPCAEYLPTAAVPLKEDLFMRGTLSYNNANHGSTTAPGSWTAVFTNSSNKYQASPVGTYPPTGTTPPATDRPSTCPANTTYPVGGFHVLSDPSPNGIVIKDSTGATVCSGAGFYERHAQMMITIEMTSGNCGFTNPPTPPPTTSTVKFTGVEVAYGPLGGPDLDDPMPNFNADAFTDGTYKQS